MDRKKIAIVKSEIRRLQSRISELEISAASTDATEYNWQYPKETGAVRRASMDLTRASSPFFSGVSTPKEETIMSFVQRELSRIQETLVTGVDTPEYDRLYAASQALSWSLEPNGVKSPYDLIMGIPANLADCSDECRPPRS